MKISTSTLELLEKYKIDLNNGFLPKEDPLNELPKQYLPWENLNRNLATLIKENQLVSQVDHLATLPIDNLSHPEQLRALLVLGALGHAYLSSSNSNFIPPQIAIPWTKVADQLKCPPVLSHSSLVLQNWKRKDTSQPMKLNNLETQISFTNTSSESYFFLVTTMIEKIGAQAIPLLLESVSLCKEKRYKVALNYLEQVIEITKDILGALRAMYDYCDPDIFYNEIRMFFDSFHQVEYQGTTPAIRSYVGGSAAQSSLLQFFDMVIGMDYGNSSSRDFLLEMRRYMPFPHRQFLNYVEKDFNLKSSRRTHESLDQACVKIKEFLVDFRNEHLKMVSKYIVTPARKNKGSITGTGGTHPLKFLKTIRNKNLEN